METDWKVSNSSSCHGDINTSSVTIHSLHSLDCNYLNHHPAAKMFSGLSRKSRCGEAREGERAEITDCIILLVCLGMEMV